jgi:hypothetical protein
VRARLLPLVAVFVIALGTVLPGIAAAQPDDSLATSPVLKLRTLGIDPNIALYGVEGEQTFTFPVPPGLTPAELTGTVLLPVNARGGILEVIQDDRSLARVPLPVEDRSPVVVPLSGARIVDNAITVRLRSYLILPEDYCVYDPTNPLRLVDTAVRYTGQEQAPATVADILPPVLERLTIFVRPNPTKSESDAAIKLATAAVARYGAQFTDVDVTTTDGRAVPPSRPLERQIIVREGPEPGLSLQGPNAVPALLVSGTAGELTNQARLLSSDISQLAVSSKAVVGPLSTTPELPGDLTTIRNLGQPGINATALVNPQVTIPLDQTRMGRSVHGVRVQLQGSYTPLPASIAGQVVVSVAGETIDRWQTEAHGRIDRWVEVPDRLLQRYTNLLVAVEAAGNTGRCGEFQPITLTIDGGTPVQTSTAKPPIPSGFQSLPQALMPRMEVGIDDGFDNLRRALLILVGLQRLSARPMDTAVVSLRDAIGSPNPAVLVSADGWSDKRITLPVAVGSDGGITVESADGSGESTTLTLDTALGFGSLQTTYDGNRTLLIATSNNAAGELDRLIGWLDVDVNRWSRLAGDAALELPSRDPVTVTTESAQPAAAASNDRSALWWAIGAVVVALALVGAALFLLRRRRSRGQL